MKYTLDIYLSIASSPFTWKIKRRYLKIYTTSRSMDPCYDLRCVTLVATLAMMAPESIHNSSILTLLFRRFDLCSSLASLKGPSTRKKTGKVVYSPKAFCSTNIPRFQTTQESNEPNFLVEGGVPQAAKFKCPTKLLY